MNSSKINRLAVENVPGEPIEAHLYHKITSNNVCEPLPECVQSVLDQLNDKFKTFHDTSAIAYFESRDAATGWFTVKSIVRGDALWSAVQRHFKERWRWDLIDRDGTTFEDAIRIAVRQVVRYSMTKPLREEYEADPTGSIGQWIDAIVDDYSLPTEHEVFARDSRIADYMEKTTGAEGGCFDNLVDGNAGESV
jgi:hypothetical protein